VKFQIGVSNYNAIYGSFAALPLFMIWVRAGWLIVLFGAQISFASQNYEKYEFETEVAKISPRYKKMLALLIVQYVVRKFAQGLPAPEVEDISHDLEIPSRITREIINILTDAGIVSEIAPNKDFESTYQPAIDINLLSVKYVVDKIDSTGIENLDIAKVGSMQKIQQIISSINQTIINSKDNLLLKDV
jgi:membrane protein